MRGDLAQLGMSLYFSDTIDSFLEQFDLNQGALVLLEGDLGLGKTTFVRELIQALGADASQVQSPTFLKLLEYRLKDDRLVLHMDAYRMEDEEEFYKLGLEAYEDVALFLVEWPALFEEYLKKHEHLLRLMGLKQHFHVNFSMAGGKARNLVIEKR